MKTFQGGVGSLPAQANGLDVRPFGLGPKSSSRGVTSLPGQANGLVARPLA